LHLRDNLLRDEAGRSLAEALRKHKVLTTLTLDLNSIDFRHLHRIKQQLERNARLHERARPTFYRRRIEELKECAKEVNVLANTLKRNKLRKRKAKMKHAAIMQELKDSKEEEKQKEQVLQEKLRKVQEARNGVDTEIAEVQLQLRKVVDQGDYDVNNLRAEIEVIDEKIRNHQRHMDKTTMNLQNFEDQARDELAELREDLGKKEKERDIALASSDAAHRHLDNFTASMRSIESDIAGGGDPRTRVLEQEQTRNAPTRLQALASSAGAPSVVPKQPPPVVPKQPPAGSPKAGSRSNGFAGKGSGPAAKPKAQMNRTS